MGKAVALQDNAERKAEPIRNGYGRGLLEAGRQDDTIVSLDADLAGSTRSQWFGEEFPDRFYQMGISEQDMIVTAAGMASAGKHAFASTFAIFSERAFEQVRTTVARMNLNVKVIGSHGGILTGQDGSSAQAVEDLGIYRTVPNMRILCPGDVVSAEKATLALAKLPGPAYMRTTRAKVPIHTPEDLDFEIGKGYTYRDGDDVALVACGPMVSRAMEAAETLEGRGVSARVVDMPTLKPIDVDLVEELSREVGRILTCEDHNIYGGLGSAVAEALVETRPCRMDRLGVQDTFGESGLPEEMYEKYGLTSDHVVQAAEELLKTS